MENQNPIAEQPTSQMPEQSLPSPENSNRSFWKTVGIGLSIVSFFLAIAIGGYLFVASKNQEPEQVACTLEAKLCPDGSSVGRTGPNCEFSLCPTVKVDETANWKTYENTEFGYTVKYPPNYSVFSRDSGKYLTICDDEIASGDCAYHPFFGVSIFESGGKSLEEWVNAEVASSGGGCEYNDSRAQFTKKIFLGYDAYYLKAIYDKQTIGGVCKKEVITDIYGTFERTYFKKGQQIYRLIVGFGGDPKLNQILSTFRFVDSN